MHSGIQHMEVGLLSQSAHPSPLVDLMLKHPSQSRLLEDSCFLRKVLDTMDPQSSHTVRFWRDTESSQDPQYLFPPRPIRGNWVQRVHMSSPHLEHWNVP